MLSYIFDELHKNNQPNDVSFINTTTVLQDCLEIVVVVVVVVVVGQTVWPISSNQLLAKQLIASQATSP